jgi:hypothetical protein
VRIAMICSGRVLQSYLGGNGTMFEIAGRFDVSVAWVRKIVKAHRDTGLTSRPLQKAAWAAEQDRLGQGPGSGQVQAGHRAQGDAGGVLPGGACGELCASVARGAETGAATEKVTPRPRARQRREPPAP